MREHPALSERSQVRILLVMLGAVAALAAWSPAALAYGDWSSGCSNCHSSFTASTYTSKSHGVAWTGGLHSTHWRMVSNDCGVCHKTTAGGDVPVSTGQSIGMKNGSQTLALGCVGCHDGPGLRQHHRKSGASTCSGCHSNPETAQAENVARPYYFTPDTAHPNKPTDGCNANGSETWAGAAGSPNGLDNDGNLAYDLNDAACAATPAPPHADAGAAQTVASGATVTLNGSNSTGGGLTYQWTQTAGPAVTLSTPTAATARFVAPAVAATGASLTFQLTVTDSLARTSTATTTVNVTHVNQPPVANAGANQTVNSGAAVSLNGANSSDPDGTIVSYQWAQTAGATVTLSGASSATATFTAPAVPSTGASLTFRLTVTDNGGLTASATTTVNVTYVNQPPVANAGPPQTVNEGANVALDGSNSIDPDGTIVSYQWSQTAGPAVTLSSAAAVKPTFVAPQVGAAGASLTFRLTVTDNGGLTASATTTVNVSNVNKPPVANAGPTQTVASGATVTLDGSNSTDPDGTIASYRWTQTAGPTVTLSSTTVAKPTFTAPTVATTGVALTFQLTVTDDGGLTASATTIVNVTPTNTTPPVANAGSAQTVPEGMVVILDGSGSTGSIATYRWTQTAGPSVTLSDPTATRPTFTAPAVGSTGASLTFQLTVADAAGLSSSATVIVNVTNVNEPPAANAGPNQTVAAGATVSLDGSASSDPDGTIVSYLWRQTAGPSVTLSNPAAARPTFTAPSAAATLTFQLTVTDDGGLSGSASVTITVTAGTGQAAVTLTANPASPQPVSRSVTFSATATGPNAPYQYRFSLTSPDGRTFVTRSWSSSNTWRWFTSRAGTYHVRVDIRASNTTTVAASATINYVVTGSSDGRDDRGSDR